MQLELLNDQGQATAKFDAPETVFGRAYNEDLVHQVVVAFQANARQGTRAQKDREQVKHSTKKPFKQKGTGRARAGMTSSPLWRGGGRIHPPEPREHRYAMPVKARRSALRNAIFTKFRDQEVAIADGWPTGKPNTKSAVAILKKLGIGSSVTVVTTEVDRNLVRSLRNVPLVDVSTVGDLNVHQVLLRRYLVLTPAAFAAIEQRFAKKES